MDDVYTVFFFFFLHLAFLYLAETVIIMPSPRNHILDSVNLAAALSGNGQFAKSKCFNYKCFYIKIQNTEAAAAEFSTLDFEFC